jgi:thiamine biosynthesis lipoprotein
MRSEPGQESYVMELRKRRNSNYSFFPAALACFLLLLAPGAPPAGEMVTVEREAYLMGTICTIRGEAGGRSEGLAAIEAGFAAIRASEALLSTWRDDTPLARLGQAPAGQPMVVPADLVRALGVARSVWDMTGGAFDPAIGALVAAWDLRGPGRVPTPEELAMARSHSGMHRVKIDPAGRQVTLQVDGLSFDAGGFGKGEGLARAATALQAAGLRNWMIDFGGQVVIAEEGPARHVPVADPHHRDRAVATLRLVGVSAATSSPSEKPGHILDPRSGRPVELDGSVTVVGKDPLLVDALATGFFVLGPQAAMKLAEAMAGIEALFLVPGEGGWVAHATPGLDGLLLDLQVPLVAQTKQIRVTGQPAMPASRGQFSSLTPDHVPQRNRPGGAGTGESGP